MTGAKPIATRISNENLDCYKYSVCTLVTKLEEYEEMQLSFIAAGFDPIFTEFLYIDNSKSNEFDGFSGLNKFLLEAKGTYIILCHQDILLINDNLNVLESRMSALDLLDNKWAILSNAGASKIKHEVFTVTESDYVLKKKGIFPTQVKSVDESFILLKRNANLSLSSDLAGFHLYGTDICMIASMLGYNSYVIDFNILHKSKGKVDHHFIEIREKLILKYTHLFKGSYYQTTNTSFYISSLHWVNKLLNTRFVMFFVNSYYRKKQRKLNEMIK
jgi:hypothetical protein